ncbi:MAG: LysE family transporter [Synergistaceae bacterium]|nr:LysE family transporter [Synergistaceae bacterium]
MFNAPAFFSYIFITAITPGPNNILSMSNAARVGLRRALPFNLGIVCGLAVMFSLCTLLSAALFTWLPTLALQCAGAVYMLYLSLKIYKSTSLQADDYNAAPEGMSFINGMTLQFVNIKIIIYIITAMSIYILPYFSDPLILMGFAALLALFCFCANMSWALFGSLFFKLFTRRKKIVNTVMALLLVYCAVSLFF